MGKESRPRRRQDYSHAPHPRAQSAGDLRPTTPPTGLFGAPHPHTALRAATDEVAGRNAGHPVKEVVPPYVADMDAVETHRLHLLSPGSWPTDFPLTADGKVEEGLVVRSKSGLIEGRTTGARLRCYSTGCPGWFIGVSWETGQRLRPCSQGWTYDPQTRNVRITGGGEISARFVSPAPLGVDPTPRSAWPLRDSLSRGLGWRVAA